MMKRKKWSNHVRPFETLRNTSLTLRFPFLVYGLVHSRPKMRVCLVLLAFEKGDGRVYLLNDGR